MSGAWGRVEREAFAVDSPAIEWRVAVVGAIATAGPLAIGAMLDRPEAGLFAALGGLNVGLGVAGATLRRRALRGAAELLGGAAVGALATALHPSVPASVVATIVITGALALTAAGDRQDALTGFGIAAVFVIVNGLDGGPADAAARGAALGVGGAVALALFLLATRATGEPADRPPLRVAMAQAVPTPRDPIRGHGVRVGLTTGVATAAYRLADLSFGYWIPLTALAVLQPDGHSSLVRAVQRTTGTLVGVVLVVLAAAVTTSSAVLIALVALASGALFALRGRSYHWLVTLLTPTALLMISTLGETTTDLAVRRVGTTAAGVALAVLAAAVARRR